MSATSLFNATQYVSQICGLAQSLGMTLQVSTDFEALRETLAQRPELTLRRVLCDPRQCLLDQGDQ